MKKFYGSRVVVIDLNPPSSLTKKSAEALKWELMSDKEAAEGVDTYNTGTIESVFTRECDVWFAS